MRRVSRWVVLTIVLSVFAHHHAGAAEAIQLNAVTFPESKTIKFGFQPTSRVPGAEVEGKVEFKEGQAEIEIEFRDMKPAVLFGGDITCYVVWAVSRDGTFDNLGELWIPGEKGKVTLTSGRKSFALLVTAEAYSRAGRPSEMVILSNNAVEPKKAPTDAFEFENLSPAAEHQLESIGDVAWDSDFPLDLKQAERVYEFGKRQDAPDYASDLMRQASTALAQARNLASKDKHRIDYSRRSIDLTSDAIEITLRRKEAEELEQQIALRRAEMEALETRAREAEERSRAAAEALEEAGRRQTETETSVRRALEELDRVAAERAALETEKAAMTASLLTLREESARLTKEREELSSRLEGALSQVAETHESARGTILSLPDILFDLNKAALKPETKVIIGKLSGILLIMPDLNVRVEGYTDSTGSDDYNLRLSEERAQAVTAFLQEQGIDPARLQAVGYGKARPVADNGTAEGRKKNRRVEIVVARGEIGE